jgi:hypothetical protein
MTYHRQDMKRARISIIVSAIAITSMAVWLIIAHKKMAAQQETISSLEGKTESQEKEIADLQDRNEQLEKKVTDLVDISNHLNQLKASVSGYSFSSPGPAFHGRGSPVTTGNGVAVVVYRRSSCDYFILENSSGYVVAEWMGGNDPDEGDKLTGDFNSFGTHDFYNQTKESESNLWIDDYMLSKEDALDKIKEECN